MTITYEGVMGFPKTEAEWAERASRHLKAELKRAGITYVGLANLLKKQGFRDEAKTSISSKLDSLTGRGLYENRALCCYGTSREYREAPSITRGGRSYGAGGGGCGIFIVHTN